jgi:hypothetical protein
MWKAHYADGSTANSTSGYWTNLPKDKPISKLSLGGPATELVNKDSYYFVTEAFATVGGPPTIESFLIGGLDKETQMLTEIRFELRTKKFEKYSKPLKEYKYSVDILIPGVKIKQA